MKRFTLYTPDKLNSFSLDTCKTLAAEPAGLGNKFNISYKESTDKKYMTNNKPDFDSIKLRIYFNADGSNGYVNYKVLMSFLASCGEGVFLFEYNDGITKKLCDVVLKDAPKSEISPEGEFAENFVFDRLSYWYEEVAQSFILKSTDNPSAFPLRFPLKFFGKTFTNSFTISNDFYEPSPINIKISGEIANNIVIYIKEKISGATVGEIDLATNSTAGQSIIINSNTKKITIDNGEIVINGYSLTDKTKQSFLYLPKGDYIVGSNITQDDGGEINISILRYLLD